MQHGFEFIRSLRRTEPRRPQDRLTPYKETRHEPTAYDPRTPAGAIGPGGTANPRPLYDFVTAVENHYFSQLRQQPGSDLTLLQQDLFEDLQHHDETLRR